MTCSAGRPRLRVPPPGPRPWRSARLRPGCGALLSKDRDRTMPRTRWFALVAAILMTASAVQSVGAQSTDKPVGNLRIAEDATGTAIPMDPSAGPGDKIYRLPSGIDQFYVAFDYQGSEPTDIAVRVVGPMGAVVFEERQVVDKVGTHVIIFKQGTGPLADNEYVVNAYVGKDQYLADSLQLAVGEAQIPGSVATEPGQGAQATAGGMIPTVASGDPGGGEGPPNPFTPTLILALVGLVVLVGVVLWAVRSAMKSAG